MNARHATEDRLAGKPGSQPYGARVRRVLRPVVDVALILTWLVATFSGVILWPEVGITPAGPGKGEKVMLWTLTTAQWGDIHTYASLVAVAVTVLHVWIDWKALKGAIKYLAHARRAAG